MTSHKNSLAAAPGATRPQAARMQPVVRNRGIKNVRKPSQQKSK